MQIILKQKQYQIKNGYAMNSPELGLAAHGHSLESARCNLEKLVISMLKPFQRDGKLEEEIHILKRKGIQIKGDGSEIEVLIH